MYQSARPPLYHSHLSITATLWEHKKEVRFPSSRKRHALSGHLSITTSLFSPKEATIIHRLHCTVVVVAVQVVINTMHMHGTDSRSHDCLVRTFSSPVGQASLHHVHSVHTCSKANKPRSLPAWLNAMSNQLGLPRGNAFCLHGDLQSRMQMKEAGNAGNVPVAQLPHLLEC